MGISQSVICIIPAFGYYEWRTIGRNSVVGEAGPRGGQGTEMSLKKTAGLVLTIGTLTGEVAPLG